LLENIFRYA